MRMSRKCLSFLLALALILTVMTAGFVPGTTVKTQAAGWNGYNYGGGTLYGYQTILEAYGIDYGVYMKWLDDHDKDSPNPNYYLGTPYVGEDHRNPHGDCQGAYGYYDTPGVEGMNCTGFVWHVLYKAAVHSGASWDKIDRLGVMGGVLSSWYGYGVNRIWFDSLEDAYRSGVLEKGDVMWIYGTSDNHNAIFYGNSPKDFIYWDSAGERNRYCEVHAIGDCQGLWVAKVTQPDQIELKMDTAAVGNGIVFGTKYMVFDSKEKAQACLNDPDNDAAWEKRIGTIVLDENGHGCLRKENAPSLKDLWPGDTPRTDHSYFKSAAKRVDASKTYYAVQWSHTPGVSEDHELHVFKDSGERTSGAGYRIFAAYAPVKVDTPAITGIKSISDGVRISWNSVGKGVRYRIYYKSSKGGWARMAETTSTSYVDKDVKNGTSYTYTVRCVDKFGNFISDYNGEGWNHRYHVLDTPQVAFFANTPEGVKIMWDPVENTIDDTPVQYRVYYKNSKGSWTKMTQTTETSYVDDAVGEGKKYTYTVRCVDDAGDFVSKYDTAGWSFTYRGVEAPQLTEAAAEAEGVRLKWNAVDGVAKYRVYCKNSKGEWRRIGETAETEFFDGNVTPGSAYTYTVRCINSKGYTVSPMDQTGKTVTYTGIGTPQITQIQSEPDGVRMAWNPVEGAVRYRVYYQKSDGSWSRIAELDGTEYLDDDVTAGNTYTYTVRCVNNAGGFMSDYNRQGFTATYNGTATPEITEMTDGSDGVHIRWSPVEGAYKYRVYYKNSKGSWVRMGETEDTEFLDDDVALGKTYTYTVRCVNRSGKFASDYNRQGWAHRYDGVAMPQITALENTADGIVIRWDAVEGAAQYRVFVKGTDGWERLGLTEGTDFTAANVEAGKSFTFTVRCVGENSKYISDYDHTGSTIVYALPEAE